MAFADLPINLQNLMIVEHESYFKMFILLFLLVVAIAYIFVFSKDLKSTPFMLVGFLRVVALLCSWIYLVFSPLLIGLISSPMVTLDIFLSYIVIIYTIGGVLSLIVFMLNIFFYGGMWLFGLMNVADSNPMMNKFKKWQNNVNWELNGRNS